MANGVNTSVMERKGNRMPTYEFENIEYFQVMYKKKNNCYPRPQTAERKTHSYSNVSGARRRQKKEWESEEDMAKHLKRRPGRYRC